MTKRHVEVDHAGVLSSGDGGLDFHKLDEWTEVKRPREVGVHWWKRGKKQCLVASGKCRLCFDFHRDHKAPSKSLTLGVGSTTASDCVSDRLYLAARQGCRPTLMLLGAEKRRCRLDVLGLAPCRDWDCPPVRLVSLAVPGTSSAL
jgi:hypothetical protein